MSDSVVNVNINLPKKLQMVLENDSLGVTIAKTWHRLINPYTPKRGGLLEGNVEFKPFEITYKEDYASYMYYGEVYVDPVFKAGGFTNNGGIDWFSRKGVKKIPSGRKFNYRKDRNKQATDHWDKAAEQAGQKEKLAIEIKKEISLMFK